MRGIPIIKVDSSDDLDLTEAGKNCCYSGLLGILIRWMKLFLACCCNLQQFHFHPIQLQLIVSTVGFDDPRYR